MTLPTSGPISAAMINQELGRPFDWPFNINGAEERALAKKPSGPISFSDFYGTQNGGIGLTGYWEETNSIPDQLSGNVPVLLADGRVFAISSASGTAYIGTVNGSAISWVATAGLLSGYPYYSTLLQDGRILTTTGYYSGVTYIGTVAGNSITWTQIANPPNAENHTTATLGTLKDGRVILAGGGPVSFFVVGTTAVQIGTVSGNNISWINSTPMNLARAGHAMVILDNGDVLCIGGTVNVNVSSVPTKTVSRGVVTGNSIAWSYAPETVIGHNSFNAVIQGAGGLGAINGSTSTGSIIGTDVADSDNSAWYTLPNYPIAASPGLVTLSDGRVLGIGGINTNPAQCFLSIPA